jgi:hypothetical protein
MNDLYFVQHYNLRTGDRIVVPKSKLNIIQHHVVYLGRDEFSGHYIAENIIGIGVRFSRVSDFFQKNPKITRIEYSKASPIEQAQIVRRALIKVGSPYKLLTYNCEHFANEIIQKKQSTSQIGVATGFVLLVLIIAAFYKN